jgi:peptidoglycan/xylan/chitin deacetylase (PgdA/CDA1 family)
MKLTRLLKSYALDASQLSGVSRAVLESTWRQQRLSIIGWHAISADDLHLWAPNFCISKQIFRQRLEALRDLQCNVLPLSVALSRLRDGTLPPKSVSLTIDDGDSSMYTIAWPLLREFQFPATLYWTTYYSVRQFAVFDPMLSFLLWKLRHQRIRIEDPRLDVTLDSDNAQQAVFARVYSHARDNQWSAERKESLLEEIARSGGIDYADLRQQRVLRMITLDEAREMHAGGLDIQLHTHRHRVPRDRNRFEKELTDNVRILQEVGSAAPRHFCYPSGSRAPEFADWLRQKGVVSSTTTQHGLASAGCNPYFLPRVMDSEGFTLAEFVGGISGVASWFTRQHAIDPHGFG